MRHPVYRVQEFEIVAPYTLRVRFDDDTWQTINFQPVLAGELYGLLRDLALFNQVRIDPEVHTLVWPNGADFDPATLHDWPEHQDAMIAMARTWTLSA
ncbi:MAG: hypothetical protein A3F84_03515 [Candidatus Handelsmanbacteria bacterium RIFCSPLOWO2_12_FULL_64_10]|uniref:DUF2442 domain-containing protein n=1 Tax=Handelsmanbacteria sp. (strain RIFCSPLOWO2_12_FULL_64_10) TaxID=1817868 RepID=A0A1F6CD29_HANXR|nr:MAG: hypothetical protein A3F84_03515 [Candidatus Handelsmanbacteria bacterium RIFCSPLOWO2_12_FULL_64_10]